MYTSERRIATSVLVIGTGGSGLRAVIELVERRVGVLAVGKRPKTDAHTSLAAGGINAALATIEPEDTWQQHAADMLKESYLLANPHTARIVTESAARGTADLEGYGVPFAREEDGHVSQRFFGAHTYRRAAFAGATRVSRPSAPSWTEPPGSTSPSSTLCTSRSCSCTTTRLRLRHRGRHPLCRPRRRPVRDRRGVERPARGEPARRQLVHRTPRLRPHRRRGGGGVLRRARRPAPFGRIA